MKMPAVLGRGGGVLLLHALLAPFVALRGYVATQDGPSHLYAAHALFSIRNDPDSPYARAFVSNLRPAGNSLYTYIDLALEPWLSPEQVAGLVLFAALVGFPLSALAFTAALRSQERTPTLDPLPAVSAACLACPLAYNYFLYRGFYNYALSVPLAMTCLAAVVATGGARIGAASRAALGVAALALGVLTALAHPAAAVLLFVAIPLASLRGPAGRRVVAGAVLAALGVLFFASRIQGGSTEPTLFSHPVDALFMFVRALGVTHSWFEFVPGVLLLLACGWGAARALRQWRSLAGRVEVLWPAFLAAGLVVVFFFVPYAFGGTAGMNERIPLFAALLVLPYVPLGRDGARAVTAGFAAFAVYTAAVSVSREARVEAVRETVATASIPKGSRVYSVSLRIKFGSLQADLGRHLLADLARRGDYITAEVFCGHPGHVVRCTEFVPPGYDAAAIEDYEFLSPAGKAAALENPESELRKTFATIAERASVKSDYLVVLGEPTLDAAFEHDVLAPLHAEPLGPESNGVRAYRFPRADHRLTAR